jgi:hypothetical protein
MDDVSSPYRGRFQGGGPVLKAIDNPYRLSLKDIINPAQEKEKITTVLLNDLCEALLTGLPIDHVPASKNDLTAGYQLLKMFLSHKETLLAKNTRTIQFNIIYFNCAFTNIIVPKEDNRTLATMPARDSWVGARLSNSCSPSVGLVDFDVTAVSVVFCIVQVYFG